MATRKKRCKERESGGYQCELAEGHEDNHSCEKALQAYLKRTREGALPATFMSMGALRAQDEAVRRRSKKVPF